MSSTDLGPRLNLALTSALNQFLFVPDTEQIRKVQTGILNAMVRSRDEHDPEGDTNLVFADDEDFFALTHPILTTPDGPQINDIWFSAAFLLPAIAATAQLWERIIRIDGDSLMTIRVSRTEKSLTGFSLTAVEAQPIRLIGDQFEPGDLSPDEYLRISTLLSGAAYFILGDTSGDFLRCALNYLVTETAKGGDRPDTDHSRGISGFILTDP